MFQNYMVLFKLLKRQSFPIASCSTKAVFKLQPATLFKLDKGPNEEISIDKSEILRIYKQMCVVRRMENDLANLYTAKLMRGFCHLYAGQEAVCTGIHSCLSEKDTVITSYRCHGWTFIMGMTPLSIISELLGKESGVVRGRGGSMHLYANNFYGGNGIVGAHLPLGTGLGLKHKYTKDGGMAVVCYGDGAANQGQTFESFNFAKLQNLPVLYVIENNGYGMGTSAARSSANTKYYTRGDYIPGFLIDGMNVLAVKAGTLFAKKYITDGNGPILMEVNTYRYFGHSMSDPGTSYRTRDEVKNVRQTRDPLKTIEKILVENKTVTEEELKKLDNEAKNEIADATATAKKHKEVILGELTSDIYSTNLESKVRTVRYDTPMEHLRIGPAINFK